MMNSTFEYSRICSDWLAWLVILAWLAILASPIARLGWASDQVPGQLPKTPVLLTGGVVHTVSGPTLSPGALLMDVGKIIAVGASVTAPANATVVRLDGKHVYPGLIEAKSQLGLVEIDSVRATVDTTETGTINPNVRSQVAFNPDSEAIPIARANGILMSVIVPTGGLIGGRQSMMLLDGWTWEDMCLKPDVGMTVAWPRFAVPRMGRAPGATSTAEQPSDASQRIRELVELLEEARDYERARDLALGGRSDRPLAKDARLAAMREVVAGRMPLVIEANETQQIQSAVAFAKAQGVRIIISGGSDAPQCAALLVEGKVPVIVEGVYRLPRYRHDDYDAAYTLPARLQAAGVPYCISATGRFGASGVRNLPYHAATAAAFGLTGEQALRSITLSAAEIFGVQERAGSLEAGKDATLFIANGDILETATQVEQAYVQGRPVDLSNHHTELYDKYRTKYQRLPPK
jgi:imidazolonepropionase-like amidohydrolase